MPPGRRSKLTVKGEHPTAPTILGAYELEATLAGREVASDTAAAVRSRFPSGRTGSSIRGYVSKTPTGISITVKPSKARMHIAKFVEAGTGIAGPRRRLIAKGRRGRLPSGIVPTGRGQAPQWPFERTRERQADAAVRELSARASSAAKRIFG